MGFPNPATSPISPVISNSAEPGSGISLIGSIVIAGSHYDQHQMLAEILGCAAVTSAMINVTGGFLITDRMLKMFRKKEAPKPEEKK